MKQTFKKPVHVHVNDQRAVDKYERRMMRDKQRKSIEDSHSTVAACQVLIVILGIIIMLTLCNIAGRLDTIATAAINL